MWLARMSCPLKALFPGNCMRFHHARELRLVSKFFKQNTSPDMIRPTQEWFSTHILSCPRSERLYEYMWTPSTFAFRFCINSWESWPLQSCSAIRPIWTQALMSSWWFQHYRLIMVTSISLKFKNLTLCPIGANFIFDVVWYFLSVWLSISFIIFFNLQKVVIDLVDSLFGFNPKCILYEFLNPNHMRVLLSSSCINQCRSLLWILSISCCDSWKVDGWVEN